jgi:hypothetical protein
MAAVKKRDGSQPVPDKKRKKDKLLFAANATPVSLLLLSSSNASLCVWYVVGSQIFIQKKKEKKTPDANTSNRKRLIEPYDFLSKS